MQAPFKPSHLAHVSLEVPNMERPTGGVYPRKDKFMSTAEYEGTKAAFMRNYDKTKRDYKVLPGGNCVYTNGAVNTCKENASNSNTDHVSLEDVGNDYTYAYRFR